MSPLVKLAGLVVVILFGSPVFAGPLHDAALVGDSAEVVRLVDAGADMGALDDDDLTPLIVAALAGQRESVAALLAQGADPKGKDRKGFTALHAATHAGHLDVVQLLLEHDVDVNDQENWVKLSPLHAAAERNHLAIAKTLIERGASIDVEERNGWTPVMRATFKSHSRIVNLLRTHGAKCSRGAGDAFMNYCLSRGI